MERLVFSFSVIFAGLGLGYGMQALARREVLRLPLPLDALRVWLQKISLLFFMPVAFLGAIWVVRLESARLAAMPFVGMFALLSGGALGLWAAHLLKVPRRQTGVLYGCGSFTNLGAIGGLVCFVFLGEKAFALVTVYKLLEEFTYFGVGFPIIKHFSRMESGGADVWGRIRGVLTDRFFMVAMAAIGGGALLNVAGVPRPAFYEHIIAVFIPVGTILLLCSIGLALRFGRLRTYLPESLAVAAIKFLIIPILVVGIGGLLGYGRIDEGLPLKVLLILSSMPVAFVALIPPSIYDLDLDLANSCWLLTTLGLVVVLPLLYLLVGLI